MFYSYWTAFDRMIVRVALKRRDRKRRTGFQRALINFIKLIDVDEGRCNIVDNWEHLVSGNFAQLRHHQKKEY
jgi:hypothetical protein